MSAAIVAAKNSITANELRAWFKDETYTEYYENVFSDYKVSKRVCDWFNNDCTLIILQYEDAFVRANIGKSSWSYVDNTYIDKCEEELEMRFEYFGELLGFMQKVNGANKLIPNAEYFKHKRELKREARTKGEAKVSNP